MKQSKLYKYLFVYCIIAIISTILFHFYKKSEINNYLHYQTKNLTLEYKTIYSQYKIISQLIFDTDINKPIILETFKNRDREKLFNLLINDYQRYKKLNIRQLHFQLPNNQSFLRMHKPEKFGDDLSTIRPTVKYVNENKKFIEGFEEGKIVNCFRFVYPLFLSGEYLGSVEVSLNVLTMINSFTENFKTQANLLILKEVVDKKLFKDQLVNYVKSPFEEFYFEKTVIDKYPFNSKINDSKEMTNRIKHGIAFSSYDKHTDEIKTFIPLLNPVTNKVVGALYFFEKSNLFRQIYIMSYIMTSITLLLIAILIIYIYELNKTKEQLDKKVKIELAKNRKKDMQILSQAKMISIAEMLNSIAHQWRQPLSVITTSASGLKLQKDFGTLTDEDLELFTKNIIEQSNYLSNTIESFKNLIENENNVGTFIIKNKIQKVLKLIDYSLKENNIKLSLSLLEEDTIIRGTKGLFIQVLIYILNNAIDSIIEANKEEKTIFIRQKNDENNHILIIKDTGKGIDTNIIDKVFEPYFTTKHKSVGRGIGLYASYEIITEKFGGTITACNWDKGAKIVIKIPKEKEE